MTEKWRSILEGFYSVSNLGRVRREKRGRGTWPGRILNPCTSGGSGYPVVTIGVDGKPSTRRTRYVHRLVARLFIGPCPEGMEVNHRDGDKTNNRASNLEYVTSSENQLHAYRIGLREPPTMPVNVGEDNPHAKLTEDDVRAIRAEAAIEGGPSRRAIGEQYGISPAAVDAIVWRRNWRHVA